MGSGSAANGVWLEAAPIAGVALIKSVYADRFEYSDWEPLFGATLGVHTDPRAFGFQVTVAQQRIPRRHHSDEGQLLAHFHTWDPFFEIGLTTVLN
jgi:hypothetical protein